jgi:hypothetical protein
MRSVLKSFGSRQIRQAILNGPRFASFYFEGDQGYVFWMRALWGNKANSEFSRKWFGAGHHFDSGRGPRKWAAGVEHKRFRTTF